MSYEFEPACRRMEWLDPFYKAVWEKAFADAIPISGTFELTPRCNFSCRMCYVHLKPEQIPQYGRELTAKEWIRIAQEAKEAGTTWLCVTGGEPLMHPEFETIWKELSQMGFFITLQTNASLIQGKMAKLLEEYPPRGVKITLYGSNDEYLIRMDKIDIMRINQSWTFAKILPLQSRDSISKFLLQIFYTHGIEKNMLEFHSSLIQFYNNGLMFLGPSGIGKTTQAELWNKYRDALIINGDIVFVQETPDDFLGWGTPWHGSSPLL